MGEAAGHTGGWAGLGMYEGHLRHFNRRKGEKQEC